jgi:hypothetical protein
MANSRQHQEAQGIGQIEKQLKQQMEAAEDMQGQSELDEEVQAASRRNQAKLNQIILEEE